MIGFYRALVLLTMVLSVLPVRAAATEDFAPGGINILKTNASGEPLEGAVFRIARERKATDATGMPADTLTYGGKEFSVVYESFYGNASMTGKLFQEIRTDENGHAAMYGLAHGTYYLVEIRAPAGYNRIAVPIRVSVNKYSHLTAAEDIRDDGDAVIDNTIHIINIRYPIPQTGQGLRLSLYLSGFGVVGSAIALLLLNRRRWR